MEFSVIVILIILIGTFFSSYRDTQFSKADKIEYMQSDKWKSKRGNRLSIDNYTCQMCSKNRQLEVHYITYKRLGDEKMTDLVTVCRDCHQKIHDKYGYNYQSYFPLLKSKK